MVRRAAPSPMRGLALLVIVGFADGFCSSRARHGFAPLASRADRAADEGVGEGVRINKRFGELLSRREADRAVIAGRVLVNGAVAESGQRVGPADEVRLDGELVRWQPTGDAVAADGAAPAAFEYLKYWKPVGVTCTTDRRVAGNVIDAIGHARRIFPVGRLDKPTSGLLLLTSDGRVVNAVGRATEGHGKTYEVTADRDVADADVAALAAGVVITTVAQRDRGVAKPLTARTRPCEVSRLSRRRLRIVLKEGRNRQIRKMLGALGYTVVVLHRTRVMDIDLRGLREGECRPLDEAELACLSDAIRRHTRAEG